MTFALIIAASFLSALVIGLVGSRLRSTLQGWLLALVMGALFLLALAHLPDVSEQGMTIFSVPWVPALGLNLTLYADGLALLFVLLVTSIGTAVMIYAGYYFAHDDQAEAARFLALMMAFSGSMLALVLAGNVFTLFIAWEATSLISFLLIGFKGKKDESARKGASQALVITAGGGLALLVGLLLISAATGSTEFSQILASGDLLREHPWYTAIAILLMLGAFTKSAQVPFHFWLPGAMSAPTPASSFLHSATMVKAGIYLLARFSPVMGDTNFWVTMLVGFGLATMAIGALLALFQKDLKAALAYATISQLGALVALIGLPEGHGIKAAMLGVIAHALYKCALFLVAGGIDHATGTRLMDRLGGLWTRMGGFATVTALACLSMAGVPPLLGFVAKESLLEAMEEQPILIVLTVISAALTVALALILFWDVFMGTTRDAHVREHFHVNPRLLVAGPGILAAASLITGIGIEPLLSPPVSAAAGKAVTLHLLPTGFNLTLLLSITALASGAVIFATRETWRTWIGAPVITGAQVYQAVIGGIERAGDLVLKTQNGKIRSYLLVILTTVAALLLMIMPGELSSLNRLTFNIGGASDVLKGLLLVLALSAALASVMFRQHLLAVLSLGVSGYTIGGIFLLEPAPDVALVQFLVETLATVLLILVLVRTSEEERKKAMERVWSQSRRGLIRDVVISLTIGVGVTIFALAAVSHRPTPNTISNWYLANALPEVGVNDVVGAIVTDFRGMDTIIEITVFGMASLGVLSILTRQSPGRVVRVNLFKRTTPVQESAAPAEPKEFQPANVLNPRDNPIMRTVAALVPPFAIMLALAQIFYGGSAPGDGFTAGVISGLAIALSYVVYGYEETKRRLSWLHPAPLIGAGLTLALANAIFPLLTGGSFLEHLSLEGVSFAGIHLASTTVFEIAIWLTVLGGVSTIMDSLSHPEEVETL
ncbi:MAG: DUF4040 domain-containing protein [Anaerolineae bacterium]|nr:DUF4040 domain-containing protein [Anaerolineae bacterium]